MVRFPFLTLALTIIVMISPVLGCHQVAKTSEGCRFFAGRNPAEDARLDFRNGEHHLLNNVRRGESAEPFIPAFADRACNFSSDTSGKFLRQNRSYFPPMSSSDAAVGKELACLKDYDKYSGAYNRELIKLRPQAYDDTCSKLTPE